MLEIFRFLSDYASSSKRLVLAVCGCPVAFRPNAITGFSHSIGAKRDAPLIVLLDHNPEVGVAAQLYIAV